MKEDDKKLNIKNISQAFGVSQVTVRNWIDKGIPCKRTSKGYTFDLTEAIQWREKYLNESKQCGSEYDAAKTEKEVYRAKMAKLNYERMSDELVPAKDVFDAAFETARQARDALLVIPDRLSALLAAETDRHKVHEMLTKEIHMALEKLSNDLINDNERDEKKGDKKK